MMDNPIAVRPRDPGRRTGVGRTRAVPTELSPSQSVTAAQTADAPHAPEPAQESPNRESVIDERAYAVINSSKEEEGRREERAASDEALMRVRAYARSSRSGDGGDSGGEAHADLEI